MSTAVEPQSAVSLTTAEISTDLITPIPMSFPAVLRNTKLTDRFSHLHIAAGIDTVPTRNKKNLREGREGKRWVRRKENARFAGNTHIVAPGNGDYSLTLPTVKPTFPKPLPPYLPRNSPLSSISSPKVLDPSSSNAGRFSLSVKGMRKELKKCGSSSQLLIRDVESEIVAWLQGGVILTPDSTHSSFNFPGIPVRGNDSIHEVGRTPLQLVWIITDNAFVRYVIHCCARYHEVVSFSKDVSGQRLTYLLRPNVTRPDHSAVATLDTPPLTDYSSQDDIESESDFSSDRDALDASVQIQRPQSTLSSISETSPSTHGPYRYRAAPSVTLAEDDWSVVGDDMDGDHDFSESEHSQEDIREQGELENEDVVDAERTFRANPLLRYNDTIRQPLISRAWDRRSRANSSPSRSPARRSFRRVPPRFDPPKLKASVSFYDYLFADQAE